MLKLEYIKSAEHVKHLLLRDNLYMQIMGVKEYVPVDLEQVKVLLATENDNSIGVIILQPSINNTVIFHAGLYKEYRGIKTVWYLKKCLKILKPLVFPFHIITLVPEDNKLAIAVDKKVFKYKTKIIIEQKSYLVFKE